MKTSPQELLVMRKQKVYKSKVHNPITAKLKSNPHKRIFTAYRVFADLGLLVPSYSTENVAKVHKRKLKRLPQPWPFYF